MEKYHELTRDICLGFMNDWEINNVMNHSVILHRNTFFSFHTDEFALMKTTKLICSHTSEPVLSPVGS